MKTEKLVQVHIFFIFYGFKYLCILSRRFAYLHRGSIPTSSIYASYPESLLISIPPSDSARAVLAPAHETASGLRERAN